MKLFYCLARWRYKYDKKSWWKEVVIMAETKEEATDRFLKEVDLPKSCYYYSVDELPDSICRFSVRKK